MTTNVCCSSAACLVTSYSSHRCPVIVTISPNLGSSQLRHQRSAPIPVATATAASDAKQMITKGAAERVICWRVCVCSRSAAVRGVPEDRIQRREPSVLVGLQRIQEDVRRDGNGRRRQTNLRRVRSGRRTQTGEVL